ncbi:MAG: methyl-accepting chemotaxis sensory transducer [Proteobacteria bacterium]|nr:methyl-accepting chemotaxis sensory transducer [Pseudomonadota bacterium]
MADTSTLRTKILGAFASALGIVIIGVAIGAYGLLNALEGYRSHVARLNASQANVLRIESHFKIQVQEWKNVLLRGKSAENIEKYWKGFEKEEASVAADAAALQAQLPAGRARDLIAEFISAHKQLGEGYRNGLIAFKEASADASVGDKAVTGIDRAPTATLNQAVDEIAQQAKEASSAADWQANTSMTMAVIVIILAIAGGLLMFFILTQNNIVKPAAKLVAELQTLTNGTLANPIDAKASGEIGHLAQGIEALRQQLLQLISNAKRSSSAVNSGTADLSEISDEIMSSANRASDTATALASSMEEMRGSIEQVAGNAGDVAREATKAQTNVYFSREVVQTLLDEVNGIQQSLNTTSSAVAEFVQNARSIAGLTQQVKEIADQTNLLALNAAIEAARAGEQGRGFAVVADEVRKLAEKSAQSANEIDAVTKQLEAGSVAVEHTITEGNARISANAAKSSEVSAALDQAIAGVQSATKSVEQIAGAIQQQRGTIDSVASQSEDLARMAEENSTAVSQIQENAKQMNRFASHLQDSLAVFRV